MENRITSVLSVLGLQSPRLSLTKQKTVSDSQPISKLDDDQFLLDDYESDDGRATNGKARPGTIESRKESLSAKNLELLKRLVVEAVGEKT